MGSSRMVLLEILRGVGRALQSTLVLYVPHIKGLKVLSKSHPMHHIL